MPNLKFASALLFTLCGCAVESSPRVPASEAPARDIREVVREGIPVGTKLDAAQAFLESEGFQCKLHKNATLNFKELNLDGKVMKGSVENVDYLRGSRTSTRGMVATVTAVSVLLTEDQVTDVKVFKEYIGP